MKSRATALPLAVLLALALVAVGSGCGDDGTSPAGGAGLHLTANHHLDVPEPSGLATVPGGGLCTVSDADGRLYRLDVDGRVLGALSFLGEDLEGVAWDGHRGRWLVVEEGRREVVELTSTGQETGRHHLDVVGDDPGSGLEGIAVRATDGAVFVLNEKLPARIYRLAADWTVAADYTPAAGRDLSGICWDPGRGHFWIVSDQARELFAWDPQHDVTAVFDLPFAKAEGVSVDGEGRLYVVSDSEQRLYVYEITG